MSRFKSVAEQRREAEWEAKGLEIVDGNRTQRCIEREASGNAIRYGKRFYVYRLQVPGFDFTSFSYISDISDSVEDFESDPHYVHVSTVDANGVHGVK